MGKVYSNGQSINTSQKRARTILNARVFFDAFYVCYAS